MLSKEDLIVLQYYLKEGLPESGWIKRPWDYSQTAINPFRPAEQKALR